MLNSHVKLPFFLLFVLHRKGVALAAVSNRSETIGHVLRGAVWMLGQEPDIADVVGSFVPKESEAECKIRGEALQHVPQQSRPVVLAAVRCDGISLQHAEAQFKSDRGVVLAAV